MSLGCSSWVSAAWQGAVFTHRVQKALIQHMSTGSSQKLPKHFLPLPRLGFTLALALALALAALGLALALAALALALALANSWGWCPHRPGHRLWLCGVHLMSPKSSKLRMKLLFWKKIWHVWNSVMTHLKLLKETRKVLLSLESPPWALRCSDYHPIHNAALGSPSNSSFWKVKDSLRNFC